MNNAFVHAYHLVLTTYGFWLPNDPRGSWSDFVRAWDLYQIGGKATRTRERRSLARDAHDIRARQETKDHLSHAPVHFSGVQARAVARGFGHYIAASGIRVFACSILADHVHMVIARHRYSIEKIGTLLKGAATSQLKNENIHPFADRPYANTALPTPWTRRQWSVFLESDDQIRHAIRYTEDNPVKESLKRQQWSFVVPFRDIDDA